MPSQTTTSSKTPFAERLDFPKLITALREKHGIALTEDEEKRLRAICMGELRNNDGGSLFTGDPGSFVAKIFYEFFAFIQNIMGGKSLRNPASLVDSFTGALTQTGDQNEARQLNDVTISIYERLRTEGGNLARAAELVSGQRPVALGGSAQPMQDSVYAQLAATINYDFAQTTSLNARMTHGLPASTRPLTQAGRSA